MDYALMKIGLIVESCLQQSHAVFGSTMHSTLSTSLVTGMTTCEQDLHNLHDSEVGKKNAQCAFHKTVTNKVLSDFTTTTNYSHDL